MVKKILKLVTVCSVVLLSSVLTPHLIKASPDVENTTRAIDEKGNPIFESEEEFEAAMKELEAMGVMMFDTDEEVQQYLDAHPDEEFSYFCEFYDTMDEDLDFENDVLPVEEGNLRSISDLTIAQVKAYQRRERVKIKVDGSAFKANNKPAKIVDLNAYSDDTELTSGASWNNEDIKVHINNSASSATVNIRGTLISNYTVKTKRGRKERTKRTPVRLTRSLSANYLYQNGKN